MAAQPSVVLVLQFFIVFKLAEGTLAPIIQVTTEEESLLVLLWIS